MIWVALWDFTIAAFCTALAIMMASGGDATYAAIFGGVGVFAFEMGLVLLIRGKGK